MSPRLHQDSRAPARAGLALLWPALTASVLTVMFGCARQDYRFLRPDREPEPITIESRLTVPGELEPGVGRLAAIPVLRLKGDAYTRGFQYGQAMAPQWREAVADLEAAAEREISGYGLGFAAGWIYRGAMNSVFNEVDDLTDPIGSRRRLPYRDRAWIQGIADGAGLETAQLTRLIATVMVSDASCCGFIAFGPATPDGRLLQLRNLDWGDDLMRPERATIVLIHEPEDGLRYLSIGFVGLIGSISGINEAGISLSEVGCESSDKTRRGRPMPLMLEEVLAKAQTLDQAVRVMETSPGSGGYNFLIGAARQRAGAVVEKTATRMAVFRIGPEKHYAENPDFADFVGFDCRADTAADPAIRKVQLCSNGDPTAKVTPSPRSSRAWRERYRRQVDLFERFGGRITRARAEAIALETAPKDNLHSIIYDFERGEVLLRNKAWSLSEDPPDKLRKQLRAAARAPVVIKLREAFPGIVLPDRGPE